MDLLGGYGSDDSDSSSASNSSKKPVQSEAIVSKSQSSNEVQVSKKGKKLLRLNAVLPPEILDRLTKGAASDTDSDDDGDEITTVNKPERINNGTKKKDITIGLGSSTATDNGLNSLLTDLSGFTPSVVAKKGEQKEEKLGMAFMTVSTSVSRKKRNAPSHVVDIHQSLNNDNKGSKEIVVEDVDSDSEDKTPSQNTSLKQTEGKDKVEPLFPSKPASHIRRTVPRPPSGLSAGMKRPINATPMPSNYNSTLISSSSAASEERNRGLQNEQQEVRPPQKKKSKKEIEKALRAGNLDSVNEYTQKIESISSNNPNQQQILASGLSEGGNSFGTAGLERYIPSEGASIKQGGLSGKMKGKHQIHALVSSAAKYEAEQRRMNAMGTNKGKSSRADAKKKYGW